MTATVPIISPVLVLVGATAIGKTDLSLRLAEIFGCEIISMDSVQVYRYMDIGTAKVTESERQRVPHHLIDIVNPDQQYDAACFVRDALQAIIDIHARGKIPLIAGGTGLYLSALINGIFETVKVPHDVRAHLLQRLQNQGREELYQELVTIDPESGLRVHINDTQRLLRALEIFHVTGIPWSEHLRHHRQASHPPLFSRILQLGLTCDRALLYDRIKIRTVKMMSDTFAKEVAGLLAKGYPKNLPAMQSIGYRHMLACLAGDCDMETATATLVRDTRRYAKRQMTWFKNQQQLQWFDISKIDAIVPAIASFLKMA